MNAQEPLVSADVDLRDFDYIPLYADRLFNSDTWGLCDADEKIAALHLWCSAWHEEPAGSLPNNDRLLASRAGYGVAVKSFLAVKKNAMRGWVLCTDGRLYHPVVASIALDVWKTKRKKKAENAADRARKALKIPPENGESTDNFPPENGEVIDIIPPENASRNGQFPPERPPENTKIPPENALKGKREVREREVASSPLRYEEAPAPRRGAIARACARETASGEIFSKGLKLLGKKYRPLIAKMLEARGNAVVAEALHDIDATNPDDPAKAFARLCADIANAEPKHRGPDGPPPTVEEAERRWNELERLQR